MPQGDNLTFLLTDIVGGVYCTFFPITGGCEIATVKKLCYHTASTGMSVG